MLKRVSSLLRSFAKPGPESKLHPRWATDISMFKVPDGFTNIVHGTHLIVAGPGKNDKAYQRFVLGIHYETQEHARISTVEQALALMAQEGPLADRLKDSRYNIALSDRWKPRCRFHVYVPIENIKLSGGQMDSLLRALHEQNQKYQFQKA